jgi:hypothetical protein
MEKKHTDLEAFINRYNKMKKKYHTIGTVLKIPHYRNSSKNTTLSEQFQNPIEES